MNQLTPSSNSGLPRRQGLPHQWLLLAGGLAMLAGCGKAPDQSHSVATPAGSPVTVQVKPAGGAPFPSTEEVLGTIRAKLRATIEAKLVGRISSLPVVLGQKVQKGQLIARLDAAEVSARLDQAKAALEQAERDWKRVSSLFEGQATTRAEYDAAESRRRQTAAAVAEAQAMQGYAEVLAPFDGVVTKKWVDVGDLATPGKPLLDLEDPSALQLEADLPEGIGTDLRSGNTLTVRVDPVKAQLSGTVSEMAPSVDPASRTFRIKLDLPPTAGLMSGQFARLLVPVGESTAVRVPSSAVVQRGQMEIVFVLAKQQVQMRLVKTGRRLGDEVEILAGLRAGEPVVVQNAAALTDGQPAEAQ